MTRYGHGYCYKKPHPKRCDNGCKACSMESQMPDEQKRSWRVIKDSISTGKKFHGGDFFCRKLNAWVQDNDYHRICTIGCGEYK